MKKSVLWYIVFQTVILMYSIGCSSGKPLMGTAEMGPPTLDSIQVVLKANGDSEDVMISTPEIFAGDGYFIEDSGFIRIVKTDYEDPDLNLLIKVYKERLSTDDFESVPVTPRFRISNGYLIKTELIEQSLGQGILDKQYVQLIADRGEETFNMFLEYRGKSKLIDVSLMENKDSETLMIERLYNPPGLYTIERGGSIVITPTDDLDDPINIEISLSNDRSLSKGFTSVPVATLFNYPNRGYKITPSIIEEVTEKDLTPNSYIIIKANRGNNEPFAIFLQYKRNISWSGITSPALLRMEGGISGWFKLENLSPSIASGVQVHIDNRKFSYIGINGLLTVFQRMETSEYSLAIGPSLDFASYVQLGYSYQLADKNWFLTLGIRPESLLEKLFPSFSASK